MKPELGEIKRGADIGYSTKTGQKYVWHACEKCGKESWVRISKGKPRAVICLPCSARGKIFPKYFTHNPNWHGGRHISHGYVMVHVPWDSFYHSMADKHSYVPEHRLVVARALGRCLHPWEIIHHKGVRYPKGSIKDKQDNRYPENLQMMSDLGHKQLTLLENKIDKQAKLIEEQGKQIRLLQWQLKEQGVIV